MEQSTTPTSGEQEHPPKKTALDTAGDAAVEGVVSAFLLLLFGGE